MGLKARQLPIAAETLYEQTAGAPGVFLKAGRLGHFPNPKRTFTGSGLERGARARSRDWRGQGAQDGLRQDLLDEEVVLQDHRLTGLGTQRLQDWTHIQLVPVVPSLWPHDRLHVRDTLHGLAVAVGPVEAEGRAPIMDDEGDALLHIQGLE